MNTPAELASLVLQRRDQQDLIRLSGNWQYAKGPLPDFSREDSLGLEQLVTLAEWKLEDRWKSVQRLVRRNQDSEVRIITGAAYALATDPSKAGIAVSVLRALQGVDVAVGSALLAAKNPSVFGIIDRKAWSSLFRLTGDERFNLGTRTLFSPHAYQLYTELLSELGARCDMTARDLDKALWSDSHPLLGVLGILKDRVSPEERARWEQEDREAEERRERLLDSIMGGTD